MRPKLKESFLFMKQIYYKKLNVELIENSQGIF